jgi:hypothetical protein
MKATSTSLSSSLVGRRRAEWKVSAYVKIERRLNHFQTAL